MSDKLRVNWCATKKWGTVLKSRGRAQATWTSRASSLNYNTWFLLYQFFAIKNSTLLQLQYLRGACTDVTWVPSSQVARPSLATTHPNHTLTVATLFMELEAKPRSSLLGLDLISDMGISAERRRPCSELIRTCVDDGGRLGTVKCIDDGGSLKIGPDCVQKRVRMIISVGAMPCVILGDEFSAFHG